MREGGCVRLSPCKGPGPEVRGFNVESCSPEYGGQSGVDRGARKSCTLRAELDPDAAGVARLFLGGSVLLVGKLAPEEGGHDEAIEDGGFELAMLACSPDRERGSLGRLPAFQLFDQV